MDRFTLKMGEIYWYQKKTKKIKMVSANCHIFECRAFFSLKNGPSHQNLYEMTKQPTDFVIVPFLVCWFLLLSSWSLWKKIHLMSEKFREIAVLFLFKFLKKLIFLLVYQISYVLVAVEREPHQKGLVITAEL